MMWFMMRGTGGNRASTPQPGLFTPSPSADTDAEIARRRAQVDQLEARAREGQTNPGGRPR